MYDSQSISLLSTGIGTWHRYSCLPAASMLSLDQSAAAAAPGQPQSAVGCYGAQTPSKSTIVRMWILHNRVTLGPYITDTRARTRYWSSTNHRNPKEPSHDSSRRYHVCRLRVHVTPAAVDVGSLACLLLRNATIFCNRRGWYVDTGAWNRIYTATLPQYNALVVVSICIGYVLECNAWT